MADAAAAAAPAAPAATESKGNTISQWSEQRLLRTMRLFNIINGLGLVVTGFVIFFVGVVDVSFAEVTVALYIVFFGFALFCVELNISNLQPRLRRNFGFLFTYKGRCLFVLFAATMTMALANWIGYLVGSVTAVNSLFNMYALCVHPVFKKGGRLHDADAQAGYDPGEKAVLAYLQSNPDLARKAGSAAIGFAQRNPELAQQAMAGAATRGSGGDERNPFG